MNSQNGVQVAQALKGLSGRVIQTHYVPMKVVGHLTGYEKLASYALGLVILIGKRQVRGTFDFVHKCRV